VTTPAIDMRHGADGTDQGIFYIEQLTDWVVNIYRFRRSKPSKQTTWGHHGK
jgi:hypothetical protein